MTSQRDQHAHHSVHGTLWSRQHAYPARTWGLRRMAFLLALGTQLLMETHFGFSPGCLILPGTVFPKISGIPFGEHRSAGMSSREHGFTWGQSCFLFNSFSGSLTPSGRKSHLVLVCISPNTVRLPWEQKRPGRGSETSTEDASPLDLTHFLVFTRRGFVATVYLL